MQEYTLSMLEPGWAEDLLDGRAKTSVRMHGSMRMTLRRVSRNPEHSRQYIHGDPVQLVDWKAFARTDSLIVREQRDEASANAVIVMDIGASMKWPLENDLPQISTKAEVAIRLGLWLAHSHLVLGDSVECWLRVKKSVPEFRWQVKSPVDVSVLFAAARDRLIELVPDFFSDADWSKRRCDSLWLMTDALEEWNLEEVLNRAHRPRLIHCLSSLEISTDWMKDHVSYLDQTNDVRKDYLGRQLKNSSAYMDRVSEWRTQIQRIVQDQEEDYFLALDTTPVSDFFHWTSFGGGR